MGEWLLFPPFGRAQELAKKLHIPFGYLFLSEPPADDTPIPDLRTFEPNAPQRPSLEFVDLLNDVLVKQLWYRENQQELINRRCRSSVDSRCRLAWSGSL